MSKKHKSHQSKLADSVFFDKWISNEQYKRNCLEIDLKYSQGSNVDTDSFYNFGRDFYNNVYKKIYEGMNKDINLKNPVEPKYIIQFGIILPFDLPYQKKTFSMMTHIDEQTDAEFFYYFTPVKEERFSYFGLDPQKRKRYDVYKTRVEITVLLNNYKIKEQFTQNTIYAFQTYLNLRNIAISQLNRMIMNYSFCTKDQRVCTISNTDLEFLEHYRGIDPETWEICNWTAPGNPDIAPVSKKKPVEDFIFGNNLLITNSIDPFMQFKKFYIDGRYHITNGQPIEGLIKINTSIEVLFNSILRLVEVGENRMPEDEFEKSFGILVLKNVIKDQLSSYLSLEEKEKTVEIANWFEKSYKLRNLIVHQGYEPKENEILDSLASTNVLLNFLFEKMDKSKHKCLHGVSQGFDISISSAYLNLMNMKIHQ